jgi:DNA (cytosine-5)-methyltransferase 1
MIRVLDLFSGIGGISLGLESTGHFQTVGFCEVEPFPRRVLAKHWPDVPIFGDIRELRADDVFGRCGHVDMVCGGFPCQDISAAGKGVGIEGERSCLWFAMLRIIREVRPRWVLAENVPALRTRGADTVLAGLEGAGYACWPLVVGAWSVGAPQMRNRAWLVAHSWGCGQQIKEFCRWGDTTPKVRAATKLVATMHHVWPKGPGSVSEIPIAVDGVSAGLAGRLEMMTAIGNSVVPQVVQAVGYAIATLNYALTEQHP